MKHEADAVTGSHPLAVVVPSRGRPGNVAELVEAWVATSAGAATLIVVVDDDDEDLPGYLALGLAAREPDMTLVVQEREGQMVGALNRQARAAARRHFAVGFCGDDHRPRTPGWDAELVEALREMGTGIVYGNDLVQQQNLPTAVAMTSDIIRCLGYMAPPSFRHMYVDNAWRVLGEGMDALRYLPDVVIEHLHPTAGTAQWDAGYLAVNHPRVYADDLAAFSRWVAVDLQPALVRLRTAAA